MDPFGALTTGNVFASRRRDCFVSLKRRPGFVRFSESSGFPCSPSGLAEPTKRAAHGTSA